MPTPRAINAPAQRELFTALLNAHGSSLHSLLLSARELHALEDKISDKDYRKIASAIIDALDGGMDVQAVLRALAAGDVETARILLDMKEC